MKTSEQIETEQILELFKELSKLREQNSVMETTIHQMATMGMNMLAELDALKRELAARDKL